jgi:DNA-directed RNA polymerase specialized sigma24 family protein
MQPANFATTQWSIVASAGKGVDSPSARQALAELCRRYWYPLFAYVRRSGLDFEAARDATQAFFANVLEKNLFGFAERERGRFRSFLLISLKNFLANERDRADALKRGGGHVLASLDYMQAESRWNAEPRDDDSPDKLFERAWVTTLLDRVLSRLKAEYTASGQEARFELFQSSLYGPREGVSFAEAANQLQTTEDAARQAALRLRKRYREILREEVSSTMADPTGIDDEIRGLFTAFS